MPVIPKRSYLFVDGAALEATVSQFAERYFGAPMSIDHGKLLGHLGTSFDKVFYYDALPIQERDETDEKYRERTASKKAVLESIEMLDRFQVFEGDVRRKGGGREKSRGQKKVDVAIAVDMLTHAFRRNMDEATLLTGDIDFYPLLEALGLEGMPVTLLYPPQTTNELKRAALIRRELIPFQLWRLATNAFLEANPVPSGFVGPASVLLGDHAIVGEWIEPDGKRAQLYQAGEEIIFRKPDQHNYVLEARSRNRRALLHFLRDHHKVAVPDNLMPQS